ncbi:MAG TPA: response regulator [Calditrichaeota bacterium]|nr:response regulator [Calditrichota bacterium]
MKIFVCEQDPYRAKLIHDILGVYNYKIVTLNKFGDFFKEAYQQKPAVIVMNEKFARESGTEVLSKLRTDPVTARIPVIFIRNDGTLESALPVSNDTLTEFVSEPIKIKHLRHYIDRWTIFRSLYIKH